MQYFDYQRYKDYVLKMTIALEELEDLQNFYDPLFTNRLNNCISYKFYREQLPKSAIILIHQSSMDLVTKDDMTDKSFLSKITCSIMYDYLENCLLHQYLLGAGFKIYQSLAGQSWYAIVTLDDVLNYLI